MACLPAALEIPSEQTIMDAEAMKRFRLWTVATTRLVTDLVESERNRVTQEKRSNILLREQMELAHDVIGPFLEVDRDHDGFATYHQDLEAILKRATLLDHNICKQAADVTWDFGNGGDSVFNQETMTLDRGEQPSLDGGGCVILVIAPAMYKTGKSNGDDFGKPRQLLVPMEVTCKPVEDSPSIA